MKTLFFILVLLYSCTTMAFPPVGAVGQSGGTTLYPVTNKVPYSQVTDLGSGIALIETDNENLLLNPNFEHTTGTTGWTALHSTVLASTSNSSYVYSGAKALVASASNSRIGLYQDVTPSNGKAGTQGSVGVALMVPSQYTDAVVCARVNGATSSNSCITAVNNGVYKDYEIPIVFGSAGQTAGIEVRTGSVYNSTSFIGIDKVKVKAGLALPNLIGDTEYSVFINGAAGTVSNESKDWISGDCTHTGTGNQLCTFKTGIFTVAPNCVGTVQDNVIRAIQLVTTATTVQILTTNSTVNTALNADVVINCQKSGVDYLNSSANVYSQVNGDYDWTSYTPTFGGFGTPTNVNCKHKKDGGDLLINCQYTMGTVTAALATVSLPNSLTIDSSRLGITNTTANPGTGIGVWAANGASGNNGLTLTAAGTSTSLIYFGNIFNSTTNLTPQNASTITNSSNPFTFTARVPITGWASVGTITGTFAGVPAIPSYSGVVDMFAFNYGDTISPANCAASPCTVVQLFGNGLTSTGGVTRSGTGAYQMNFNKTYATMVCWFNGARQAGVGAAVPNNNGLFCNNCSSLAFATTTDSVGGLTCMGTR